MRYWIFQAVPEQYPLADAMKNLPAERWFVTRYGAHMAPGDVVYFWQAGRKAALHGWGRLQSNVACEGDDDRIQVSYDVQFDPPVPKTAIQDARGLEELQLLRAPQGTNFKVSTAEAKRLNTLIRQKGFQAPPDPVVEDTEAER